MAATPASTPSGTIVLTPLSIGLASALMVIVMLGSYQLNLGLETSVLVGTVRTTVQLSCLGYILEPIFAANKASFVLLYIVFMLLLAARECWARPRFEYEGMFVRILAAHATATAISCAWGLLLVLHITPWWDAMHVIPITGMLLGNSISGITLSNESILTELHDRRDRIERNLALGASMAEATLKARQAAIRTGLTPMLNTMTVVGLVSIPGMMTGQILGGSSPVQAALYQIMILFLIVFNVMVATTISVLLAVSAATDSRGRIRHGFITPRRKKAADIITTVVACVCSCFRGDHVR